MQDVKSRYALSVSIIAVFAAVSLCLPAARTPLKTFEIGSFPLAVAGWAGREINVDSSVKDILETDAVLLREYRPARGPAVGLCLVYYSDGEKVALHLPESCLMGQGSRLRSHTQQMVKMHGEPVEATRMEVESPRGRDIVLYYFQTSGLRTSSYFDFRTRMLLNRIRGKRSGGALVRFSVHVPPGEPEE
ncbi:MAG: exosortase C-terminal domain/associated protein EpsI, partial [Deltaproteobacteria bacterium]